MKKILLSICIVCCAATSFAQEQLVVDANAVSRNLTESFNKIKIASNFKLVLSQSAEQGLALSASDNKYLEEIYTEVENNTLKIYSKGGYSRRAKGMQVIVYVAFKELKELNVSGAADVQVLGALSGDFLTIEMSGASVFKGKVNIAKLSLNLSGASTASLTGKSKETDLHCSGASDVNGYELVSGTVKATASGASDIKVFVDQELTADASGASHIYYRGSASKINAKTSGAAEVLKKN